MDTSIRILVCMSDRKERESIVRLLEGTGFTYVLEASRREEAENSLRTLRCSIVVCDAMLDGGEGMQLIYAENKRAEAAHVRPASFIYIGSAEYENILREVCRLDNALCIIRPYDTTELCDAVFRLASEIKSSQRPQSAGDVYELRRANDVDIGLLPYPKYDVTQQNYLSRVENSAVTAIPITARDPDRTSVIVEALAAESYNYVLPAFYDVTLRNRYSRDEDSIFMLDIALAGRRFDLGDAAWGDVVRDRIAGCLMHGNGDTFDGIPTLSELTAQYKDEVDKLCAEFVFE